MTRHCCARTFKMLGPWIISTLFSKPVLCVAHYFCEFCKEADHYFPCFCTNSSFNGAFIFLTVIHSFYCFQGPSILTWGTLSHRSHMFQQFHLFLASLVMSWKNIRLKWFGRGNINNIETLGKTSQGKRQARQSASAQRARLFRAMIPRWVKHCHLLFYIEDKMAGEKKIIT